MIWLQSHMEDNRSVLVVLSPLYMAKNNDFTGIVVLISL